MTRIPLNPRHSPQIIRIRQQKLSLISLKSGYYPVFAAINKGQLAHTLFSSPDQVWHNTLRRSVGAIFTQNSIVKYEYLIDDTLSVFLNELNERFAGREGGDGVLDLHAWLVYFAFDVVGDLTHGARHGFIEHGGDVSGIIAQVKGFLSHGFFVSLTRSSLPFLK